MERTFKIAHVRSGSYVFIPSKGKKMKVTDVFENRVRCELWHVQGPNEYFYFGFDEIEVEV